MEDEIDLREYINVIVKRWRVIAGIAVVITISAFVFSIIQKPIYEAKVAILLKGASGSNISQLAGLAGLAGINLGGGGGGGIADIPDMLKSYDLAEIAAEKISFEAKAKALNPKSKFESHRDLVETLQGMIKVEPPKGNMLEIKAKSTDKYLATDIANGYTEALKVYYNKINYTEARKKREYIEKELPRIEAELKNAEEKLKKFTLLQSLQPTSPISLDNLSVGGSGSSGGGIEVNRLSREKDIQSSVYMMLRRELENVKLEESKEIDPFMVLDLAKVPKTPINCKIELYVLIGLFLGLFSGILVSFFVEYWEN